MASSSTHVEKVYTDEEDEEEEEEVSTEEEAEEEETEEEERGRAITGQFYKEMEDLAHYRVKNRLRRDDPDADTLRREPAPGNVVKFDPEDLPAIFSCYHGLPAKMRTFYGHQAGYDITGKGTKLRYLEERLRDCLYLVRVKSSLSIFFGKRKKTERNHFFV